MRTVTASIAEASTLRAILNYVAPSAERLRNYTYDPPEGGPQSNAIPDPREVPIHDVRPIAEEVTLDEHGFGIARHRSSAPGYENEADIRELVYPEATRLLQEITGADRVHVFDHTLRRRVPGQEDRRGGQRQPVTRVHVDQTERSGPQRVRDLLPAEAEALLRGRVQIINLWRPVRGPVLDAADLVYHRTPGEADDREITEDVCRWH